MKPKDASRTMLQAGREPRQLTAAEENRQWEEEQRRRTIEKRRLMSIEDSRRRSRNAGRSWLMS